MLAVNLQLNFNKHRLWGTLTEHSCIYSDGVNPIPMIYTKNRDVSTLEEYDDLLIQLMFNIIRADTRLRPSKGCNINLRYVNPRWEIWFIFGVHVHVPSAKCIVE